VVLKKVTIASVLFACAHMGALRQGKSIRGYMVRFEVELDVVTYTSLLDMYSKCRFVDLGYKVFSVMPERMCTLKCNDRGVWNAWNVLESTCTL